ncbi:MAG: hypothetical protein OEZ02_00140 [Anaerolineae bacterium]|nr:hypothetical protein [Anaerolineae bacterium]
MLSEQDFIELAYTADLTQAGAAYVCRDWVTSPWRADDGIEAARQLLAEKAGELAWRRYLGEAEIGYDVLAGSKFSEASSFDIALGGRRCMAATGLIWRREAIVQVLSKPSRLLENPVILPREQLASAALSDEDVFVFGFVCGLVTPSWKEVGRARDAGQPLYLVHRLPRKWAHPPQWGSLGKLVLKAEGGQAIAVEIGGEDGQRVYTLERLVLPPGEKMVLEGGDYHGVSYLKIEVIPDGKIGIYSPVYRESLVVQPRQWRNLWVYGMRVILVGYMRRGEFRRLARPVRAGKHMLQWVGAGGELLAVRAGELRPVADLVDRAQAWGRG